MNEPMPWSRLVLVPVALTVVIAACTAAPADPPLAAGPSAISPEPFGDGALTTVNGLAMTTGGDELYASHYVDAVDASGRPRVRIVRYQAGAGGWSAPETVPFSDEFTDYQPVLGPDGGRMFFTSTRPRPGTTTELRQNIWFVDRAADGWGEPVFVESLATSAWDGYAVPVRRGRIYFVSDRTGGRGGTDIWMADPEPGGGYAAPVNAAALNSADSDSDIFVDPDERFIIFHRYVEATTDIQFWIAFRDDDGWRAPRVLDEANGAGWELSPTVTADGQLLFARDNTIYAMPFCALIREDERDALTGAAGTACE